MTSARYGRMELGRCVSKDYGHIGTKSSRKKAGGARMSNEFFPSQKHQLTEKQHDTFQAGSKLMATLTTIVTYF